MTRDLDAAGMTEPAPPTVIVLHARPGPLQRVARSFAVVAALAVAASAGRWSAPAARPTDERVFSEQLRAWLMDRSGGRVLEMRPDVDGWVAFYDVWDLLLFPPDYPEPEISLRLAPAPSSRGDVLTFEEEEPTPGLDADKLVELVAGALGEDETGFVACHGGVLIVGKSAVKAQERVAKLLGALRRTAEPPAADRCRSTPTGR